jgi:hypothetical protein
VRTDRYHQYGLTEGDEPFRRAVRDGFKRAGLGHAEMMQALEWYKDHVRPDMDETALAASFHEFSAARGWDAEKIAIASSVYNQIRDGGPTAVLAMPPAEEDAALIAKADELLRTNADAYFRDPDLQELALEARERQLAAPPPEPGIDHDAIERRVAQQKVDRFAAMLRQPAEAARYWASPELQDRHRRAIAASIQEAPAAAPSVAAAAPSPAASAPAKPAVSDAARRIEIEALMRVDGGKAYWRDPAIQHEYTQVLGRLAGEAPPLAPAAEAVPDPAASPPRDAA